MGGIVGLTVRFDKRKTYRGSCWTNTLPEGLFAPAFYASLDESKRHVDAWLQAILDNRKANPEIGSLWGDWNKLAPVEYGLVVVDYVTETLVSAQGYTDVASVAVYNGDTSEKFAELERRGLIANEGVQGRFKTAEIKLPFKNVINGYEDKVDKELQAWCAANFGLSRGFAS